MTTPKQIAEIVTFRLKPGMSETQFATAAGGLENRLRASGQVIARTLSQDETGLWTDHVVWRSEAAARDIAQAVMQCPDCAPFMAMIDPAGMVMTHAAVVRRMD